LRESTTETNPAYHVYISPQERERDKDASEGLYVRERYTCLLKWILKGRKTCVIRISLTFILKKGRGFTHSRMLKQRLKKTFEATSFLERTQNTFFGEIGRGRERC
jgi:hypothetical protein